MRNFNPRLYKDLFDEWDDPVIQAHMADENKIIKGIKNPGQKTFIDLGAGHGRILPNISPIAKNVISIEINPQMFINLEKRAKNFPNVHAILSDIVQLEPAITKFEVNHPVLLLLQNTLGTIEGDYHKVLCQMKTVAKKCQGEMIISLYRQPALKDWGIKSYWHGKAMNGEPDLVKTDFKKGLFVSKTGYASKWRMDEEINDIKHFFGGKLVREIITKVYWIIHLDNIKSKYD